MDNILLINADYIRGLLDARGYAADDETVYDALNAWITHLESEEDYHFIDILKQHQVFPKEKTV